MGHTDFQGLRATLIDVFPISSWGFVHMVKRIGIAVGSIAAAAVLTVGLVVGGFVPVPRGGPETAEAASQDTVTPVQASAERREPKVVYVKPARKQRTIVVERPATISSNAGTPTARVRTVRVRSEREDREDREDREGRDDHEDHDD